MPRLGCLSSFLKWLQLFNSRKITKGRKVVLLLENCLAHGTKTEVEALKLSSTKTIFHSPNTAYILQPCDSGTIAALKCRYRRLQMGRALQFINMRERIIYAVDVLQDTRWINHAWEEIDIGVIRNCRCHTKFVGENVDAKVDMLMQRDRSELGN